MNTHCKQTVHTTATSATHTVLYTIVSHQHDGN